MKSATKALIEQTITTCFTPCPADRAAALLHAYGIKSSELYLRNTWGVDSGFILNTANSMRDIELIEEEHK